jgi:adenylate kinase
MSRVNTSVSVGVQDRNSASRDEMESSLVRLVMLGPPGAGKGTQGARFARLRGIPWISTGEILRQEVQAGTALGKAAKVVMEAGRLVGDDIMIGIARDRLDRQDTAQGFVLDGFPRSLPQAEALDTLIDERSPLVVVDIEVPIEILIARLRARKICRNCGWNAAPGVETCARCGGPLVQRSDDNIEVVRERLRVYEGNTRPIVDYYRDRPTYRTVDGDQTLEAVAADISAAVASVVGSRR